ncbi:IspD/TarI family cytidylyltransferase [Alicyclobacillus dauci]|uniref:2-C-methyl-D-erythritol 4-phosphate cytidylyltransferase n=1 Tax=Alicyclobacillus dauci TaxID=1475485 RepID=A0ABY6Z5S3_9BACL|nr:IspD/TarI family cytidylyltransferase [Alicyclobacillus dauci]WAH37370.1 2-C-methyl-D-erythritol 4-phosphate cytidylyltransferase [Alicyclobacillus dauci]
MFFAVVVAAGQGRRMGFKKQFMDLAGRPMWIRSTGAMFTGGVECTVVVTSKEDHGAFAAELRSMEWASRCHLVVGGDTRHESVVAGIRRIWDIVKDKRVDPNSVLVAVHDAARPFVASDDIRRAFARASEHGAAILGRFCRDTVKWVEQDMVEKTIPREKLFLAETPQVIRGDIVRRAYFDAKLDTTPTDDSALLEELGIPVTCVESTRYNGKVTTPADLDYANWLASKLWGNEI